MDGCPSLDRLREEPEHLAACSECREKLEALELLDAPESEDERRLFDALAAEPRRVLAAARLRAGPEALRLRRQTPWLPMAAVAAACAAAVLLVARRPANPDAVLRGLAGGSRPFEVALDGMPWAPYQPRRGTDGADLEPALRKLLDAADKNAPGARRALAVLYLVRAEPGDLQRSDKELARAGPEAANERGALLYLQNDPAGALEWFLRAGATFNVALSLERLGAHQRAARAFDAVVAEKGPWSAEAAQRAQAIRSAPPPASPPNRRREAYLALLSAATPAQLEEAERAAEGMPDLLALSRRLTAPELPEHAQLYMKYIELRGRALAGGDPREVEEFARQGRVQQDPLLWAPALELAGYVHAARGDWRAAQRYEASIADACKVRGCPVENEAIALDELADLAGRDGDFERARRLQDRAEQLFTSAGAGLQLAELHRKRAALLNEENRPGEAALAEAVALRELSGAQPQAYARALEVAAQIEAELGRRLAARELGEAALELAGEDRDLEVDASALLATNAVALGEPAEARKRLETEIARLEQAGHQSGVASLRRWLSQVRLKQGDAEGALDQAERGLRLAGTGSWEWDRVSLHLAHARALRALGRDAEAELSQTMDEVARDVAGTSDPDAYLVQAQGLVAEAALSAKNADELALPLDRLRAAALHVAPAKAGWSRALPAGACVLVLIAGENVTLQAVARREGGEVRRLPKEPPAGAEFAGTAHCDELWLFAGAPLDAIDPGPANGLATSLTRLFAPEPGPPRSALFVTAQTSGDVAAAATALPGAGRERAALDKLGVRVVELSGERATPEEALRLGAAAPLLHFAVHGFKGGFLQLAGEGGRLAARDIAQAHLQPDARVVLSSCEAGAAGPGGVAWAFARAGAGAVAAAVGPVDDEAAARWSERFYAALGRGRSFAQAAREAGQEDRAARFIVVK